MRLGPALAGLLQAAAPPTSPPPPVPPASTPRAAAEALLAGEQASDVFTDETAQGASGSDAIRLRHRPSGFLCRLEPTARPRVQVYASLTRGEDVRCSQTTPTGLRVVYVYRAPEAPLAQLASNAEREIRQDVRDDATSPGAVDRRTVAASGAIPEHVVETLEGTSLADSFVLGKVDGWAVQLRLLGPHAAAARSTVLEAEWAALLADRTAPSPPEPSPPESALNTRPRPTPAPVTPQAAQAQAARLLARGEAGAYFEVVRDGATVGLRHRDSGAVCTFEAGVADDAVEVLNHSPPGSDLKCVTRVGDAVVSTFLSHLEPTPTVRAAFDSFVSEIRAVHPDAKPFAGAVADVKPLSGPESLTARFTYAREGRPVFSRLQVTILRGWIVEQRLDGPPEHAATWDLVGGLGFLRTTGALPAPGSPAPPAASDPALASPRGAPTSPPRRPPAQD